MWLLSPEVSEEKLRESLELLGVKGGDPGSFEEWFEQHPQRRWLKERIRQIRETGIRNVIIHESESVRERFLAKRVRLSPRLLRDFPRLLSLIKAIALLNCTQRIKVREATIAADQKDIDEAFALYGKIAAPNELGLSPETLRIHDEVILPLGKTGEAVSKKEIIKRFRDLYGRPLGGKRLSEDILPALESVGLVTIERNPADKRETVVYCTIGGRISPGPNNAPPNGAALQERIQAGTAWLSRPENLDVDGWTRLDKFREVVSGPETVEVMLRDGLITLHLTELNKVRLTREGPAP